MLCLNVSDIAIAYVKRVDYSCVFHNISISEATRLFQNTFLFVVVYKINQRNQY